MSTLHKVELTNTGGIVDLFDVNTATPPIAAGTGGYIQNISNKEVLLSDTLGFDNNLVITPKNIGGQTNTLTFSAGDSVFLKTLARRAVVTIVTDE